MVNIPAYTGSIPFERGFRNIPDSQSCLLAELLSLCADMCVGRRRGGGEDVHTRGKILSKPETEVKCLLFPAFCVSPSGGIGFEAKTLDHSAFCKKPLRNPDSLFPQKITHTPASSNTATPGILAGHRIIPFRDLTIRRKHRRLR